MLLAAGANKEAATTSKGAAGWTPLIWASVMRTPATHHITAQLMAGDIVYKAPFGSKTLYIAHILQEKPQNVRHSLWLA